MSNLDLNRKPLPEITFQVWSPKATDETVSAPKRSRGQPKLPEPTADDTRLQVVETFLASESLKANTRRSYARELKRLLMWSEHDWSEFTNTDLALYKDDLKTLKVEAGETSVNSLNVSLTALKSFFNWYCAQQQTQNPTAGLKFERTPLPPPKDLSQTALEWLETALAYTNETQWRDRAMVQVLSHGLRAGEMVSLNVGNYDGQRLHIEHTKTKEPRTVPLCQSGRQQLERYLDLRSAAGEALTPTQPLIHSFHRQRERLSYHGVYQAIKGLGLLAAKLSLEDWISQQNEGYEQLRAAIQTLNTDSLLLLATSLPRHEWSVAAELVHLHPHQLRHTYATRLFRQGLDPTHARRLLGHASEQTTRRYTQAVEAEAAESAYYRLIGESECTDS